MRLKNYSIGLALVLCALTAILFSMRDYSESRNGMVITERSGVFPLLEKLSGSHGSSVRAMLLIDNKEFGPLRGCRPYYVRDPQSMLLLFASSQTWPETIIIVDEFNRKYAVTESPLLGFGAFIGMGDDSCSFKFDERTRVVTLIDSNLNNTLAIINGINWQDY